MFPLIVITNPENGAENVGLDEVIKITFDGELDPATVTSANIKLINYTIDEEVADTVLSLADSNSAVVITAPQTSTGNHRYEGLNEYRVIITDIASKAGERLDGTIELRFTVIGNAITDVTEEPVPITTFEVIRTYPKADTVVTPTAIRIQCSKAVDPNTDLSGIMLINDDTIESIDDAVFMGVNLITVSDISINDKVITITIPTTLKFNNGSLYSVIVQNVTSTTTDVITPYMYSFYSGFTPFYCKIPDILGIDSIANLLADKTQYEISIKIHDNSKLAEFIATTYQTDFEISTWSLPPYYVGQYVKYKTLYDVIFDKFIDMSSGATMKQLKDMTIEYGYSIADLLALADKLKLQYQYWEDFLKGNTSRGFASAGVFQRGSNADEDPDFMTRQIKDWEGDKSW